MAGISEADGVNPGLSSDLDAIAGIGTAATVRRLGDEVMAAVADVEGSLYPTDASGRRGEV